MPIKMPRELLLKLRTPAWRIERAPSLFAAGVALVSLTLIGIWLFLPGWKQFSAGTMKFNTAFGLFFSSLALVFLAQKGTPWARRFSGVALTVGLLTAFEYLSGSNLGIDEGFVRDVPHFEGVTHPGRMAPSAALGLILLNSGFLLLGGRLGSITRVVCRYCLVVCHLVGLFSLVGYVYGEVSLYRIGPYVRISWPTAGCLVLLSAGALFVRKPKAPLPVLHSDGIGGLTFRSLYPLLLFLIVGLGWLRVRAQQLGYFSPETGRAIYALSLICVVAWALLRTARKLDSIEARRRQAELRLKESEGHFRQLAESMPQMVWTADAHGQVDYYNQKWFEFTGLSSEVAYGDAWRALIHPDDQENIAQAWSQALQKGDIYQIEVRFRRARDGAFRWILVRALPIKNERGEVVKWIGTNTDIEDQKRVQEELLQTVRARDEFLSMASHELKTPLTSLVLQIELFRRLEKKGRIQAAPAEPVARLVEQTDKQVSRLTRLVDDMLDIGRIRLGRLNLRPQQTDLCALVKDIVQRLEPQFIRTCGVPPRFEGCELAEGVWDPLRIEQVVVNLLTNAMRYGSGKPIRIRVASTATGFRLAVQDQGLGIADEDRERIFERFERAVSVNEVSGMGLGLFIARQIVQAHHGRVWVESQLGQGSTFFVELPRHALAAEGSVLFYPGNIDNPNLPG